ncbi:MAG: hypothetical protein ABJ308_12040 [Halieaceae bacterium]
MRNYFSLFLMVLALAACADYQFKVNDRVVYKPAPMFSDYEIADPALHECVAQHIQDGSISAADQLVFLNCSHAGVSDLSGLESFTAIAQLKLSNNLIENVNALAGMAQLSEVYLDGNRLRSIMPLRGLNELRLLNLQENEALLCQQLEYFAALSTLTLEPPEHCTQ